MEEPLRHAAMVLATVLDAAAIATVAVSFAAALWPYLRSLLHRQPLPQVREARIRMARGLVFSVEILIGADIVRSVLQPSLQTVVLLGAIVLVRGLLGFTLEYDLRQAGRESKTDS